MKEKTLVILAAGLGSRFGGPKQFYPVGENGEFIMDYSIYSAKKYGFTKVVFVIRKEFEDAIVLYGIYFLLVRYSKDTDRVQIALNNYKYYISYKNN